MSFALGTVLFLFLVIPGLVFKANYYSTEFAKKKQNVALIDNLIWAAVPSAVIHLICLPIALSLTGLELDIPLLSKILVKSNSSEDLECVITSINGCLVPVIFYFTWVSLIAIPLGHFFRIIVRLTGLDIRLSVLRFSNKWCYILKGESLQFKHKKLKIKYQLDGIFIDAFMVEEDKSVIYLGVLHDFYTDKEGKLESIIIKSVHKKGFSLLENNSNETKFPSTQFIIPYSKIINLNIRYINFYSTDRRFRKYLNIYRDLLKWIDNILYYRTLTICLAGVSLISFLLYFIQNNKIYIWGVIVFLGIIFASIILHLVQKSLANEARKIINTIYKTKKVKPRTFNIDDISFIKK